MADTAVAADAGGKIIDWMKNPEEMDSALEGLEASPWDNLITVSLAPLQVRTHPLRTLSPFPFPSSRNFCARGHLSLGRDLSLAVFFVP